MISSTLRIISAASVADKTTCALTCMSHQHHLTGIARLCASKCKSITASVDSSSLHDPGLVLAT